MSSVLVDNYGVGEIFFHETLAIWTVLGKGLITFPRHQRKESYYLYLDNISKGGTWAWLVRGNGLPVQSGYIWRVILTNSQHEIQSYPTINVEV